MDVEYGKYTYGVNNITIVRKPHLGRKVVIGKFCSIGNNCRVYLTNNHNNTFVSTWPFGQRHVEVFNPERKIEPQIGDRGNVVVGNDVWIGDDVTIMAGVKIGDGASVAAGSRLISNVKPYSVVGGNPAQLFYFKFSKEVIKELLRLRWWDFEDEKIVKLAPWLSSRDVKGLFEKIREINENFKS